jgi:hypothetical protein
MRKPTTPDKPPVWITSDSRIAVQFAGTEREVPCTLLEIGNGLVHVRVGTQTWQGFQVVLKFDHLSIPGEVLYCKPKDQEYLICIQLAAPETGSHRREPRYPLNLAGKLIVLSDSGTLVVPGTVADLSRSGLGLRVPVVLETESIICVETEKMLIVGKVRYCKKMGEGEFSVGIETTDVFSDPNANPFAGSPFDKINHLLGKVIHHDLRQHPK